MYLFNLKFIAEVNDFVARFEKQQEESRKLLKSRFD